MNTIHDFDGLVSLLSRKSVRTRVALACPADSHTRYVVERGLEEGIVDFTLVFAGECGTDFKNLAGQHPGHVEVIVEPDTDTAARKAVALAREGAVDVLMKGTLNTDNLLHAVLDKEHGLLRPGTVLSHPAYGKLVVFADAAVIPRPTLEQFDAILGYAVNISRKTGVQCPRVALINFTEKVNEKFPHTLYYEELKRRAAEGHYGDVLVDGPMDIKTALDRESGQIKGISSPVVIESGNVFYKTITLFAGAETAGMLCGTTVPVVVASRADSCESKFYSLAMACV